MERLKHIKEALVSSVESQIGNLHNVDAKELGEVVDMVKDMEEAIYYCSITKAMKEREEEEKAELKELKNRRNYMPIYYNQQPQYYPDYRDMDREGGRMYYSGGGSSSGGNSGGSSGGSSGGNSGGNSGGSSRGYYEPMDDRRYPMEIRDVREGKSSISRKNYMESKEMHKGAPEQMKELEKYVQELSQDITEMISDASPEEKSVLQQKLSILASKIK